MVPVDDHVKVLQKKQECLQVSKKIKLNFIIGGLDNQLDMHVIAVYKRRWQLLNDEFEATKVDKLVDNIRVATSKFFMQPEA